MASLKTPTITVHVTEELVNSAVPRDSGHCMIADAIAAAFPGAKRVAVDIQTIRLTDPTKSLRYVYLTPKLAQRALVDFDQGRKPEPFHMILKSGQTTRIRGNRTYTEAQRDQARQALVKANATTNRRAAWLRTHESGSGGQIPAISGGSPPPISALRRRVFGLRAFEK